MFRVSSLAGPARRLRRCIDDDNGGGGDDGDNDSLHELRRSGKGDKAVVFSQFTGFLDVIQVCTGLMLLLFVVVVVVVVFSFVGSLFEGLFGGNS